MQQEQLLEYYSKEHFKLHYELNHYVHFEDYGGQWKKDYWRNIVTNPKGIKRIQYNTAKFKRYIIVDIDHKDLFKFKDTNIPRPNFVVKNKHKQGGHLFWVLNRVCTHEYYMKLWEDIQKYFSKALGGDMKNVGCIGKNPYNTLDFEYIEVYPYYYEIKHLHSFVPEETEEKKQVKKEKQVQEELPFFEDYKSVNTKGKVVSTGRNVDLFNTCRKFAYQLIKEDIDTNNFKFRLLNKMREENNNFSNPLKDKEVIDIYKSIVKYCLEKWSAIKHNRKEKKVKIEEDMSIKEKLQLGAKYTNEVRKLKTQKTIENAIIEMREKGIKVNITNLAAHTKIHRNTIRNFKDLF